MQRRKVDGASHTAAATLQHPQDEKNKRPRSSRSVIRIVNPNRILTCLLAVAAFLAIGTILFPKELRQVEDTTAQTTKDLVNNAYRVEQKMEGWLIDHELPAAKQLQQQQEQQEDPTAAMQKQTSSWVDGEKKLKQQLQVLAKRQEEGIDVGVPVLTRYLGEDFPAWAGKDVDEKEWTAKVKAKYEEMAQEEVKWKERVRLFMEEEKKKKQRR